MVIEVFFSKRSVFTQNNEFYYIEPLYALCPLVLQVVLVLPLENSGRPNEKSNLNNYPVRLKQPQIVEKYNFLLPSIPITEKRFAKNKEKKFKFPHLRHPSIKLDVKNMSIE